MEVFILRIFLALLLFVNIANAKSFDINVNCEEGFSCRSMSKKIKTALSNKSKISEIKETIRFLLLDESIREFDFELTNSSVLINFSQRALIKEVTLTGKLEIDEKVILKTLRMSEGGYYNSINLNKGIERLSQYYRDRGYEDIKVVPNISKTKAGILININIKTGKYLVIRNVNVSSESKFITTYVRSRLSKFKRKPWNVVNIKIELDTITRELFGRGYFFSNVKLLDSQNIKGARDLNIKINLGLLYNFDFRGNKIISRGEILAEIKEFLLNNFEEVTPDLLKTAITKSYNKRGVYHTEVGFYQKDGKTKNGEDFRNIYFNIVEGIKIPIRKLTFKGPQVVSTTDVEGYYYDKATTLAARDYLDRKFLKDFPALLKRLYLQQGFLFIEVAEPVITFSPDKSFCNVTFHINERQQSYLEEIRLPGVDKELSEKIISKMINKAGQPLDVVNLEEDLNIALNLAREEGYYFSRIKNVDPSKLILHENNYNRSRIVIDFELGRKTLFESVLVTGHRMTQQKVISREVRLERDDLVTPQDVQRIKERIVALGLFSQVKITPFVTNRDSTEDKYYVNLLIQVNEKDFGAGEIAPGYRTDIGYKVSTKIIYNNLAGLNHSLSLKTQTNLRDNLNSLDLRRKNEDKNLLEYLVKANYIWPYAFPSRWKALHNIELSTSASIQQRRLYSFDADIKRSSLTFSKEINDKVSTSLKYQYERIRQFDSSQIKDNATFTIGGLTPSINIDLRDSSVNPRKGAFFGLTWEFANPFFGSMAKDDLEINFWKLVSRNKFYYPASRDWVLALSISTGVQKNLVKEVLHDSSGNIINNENGIAQTKGFIPSIKVFRLDGPDAVRGFATSEINRLPNGSDMSEIRVQDRAFFANLKFEPRYVVNDQVVIGPFFDAGKIYVNNFKPLELRTSTGVSLKFVTQVGTLDFDYGVKLNRKRLADGGREGFGRFHLSIGFF